MEWTSYESVRATPTSVDLFLVDRGVKERAGEIQERYVFLASLYEVMEGNGVVISDDTRTAANMIFKVRRHISNDASQFVTRHGKKNIKTY